LTRILQTNPAADALLPLPAPKPARNRSKAAAGAKTAAKVKTKAARAIPRTAVDKAMKASRAERDAQPVQFPRKLAFLFRPARYKVAHGGRGGAKSWNFARALILRAYSQDTRILCAREFQNSIGDSVHKLLSDQIWNMGLAPFFTITQNSIKCNLREGRSEFLFAGIRNNVTKIKSMEGIDIVWVEEAEKVSSESWEVLIPTIRKPGSEIWVSFNPASEDDPTYKRFVVNPPDGAVVVQINWRDNKWFPEELRKEKDYLARVDWDAYLHVWEGYCRNLSDAQVLKGKVKQEAFEPHAEGTGEWFGPYFGADWGFAQDPTTLVKCWINSGRLFIEYEAYGIGVDIDKTPEMFDQVPGAREAVTLADSARPETISYMQRHGYGSLRGVLKWPGSVEDGVAHLRGYVDITIHPRCVHATQEARLWAYKVDRLSKQVLPVLIDAHNHIWDAVRYALQPMIRHGSNSGLVQYMKAELAKDAARAGAQVGVAAVAALPAPAPSNTPAPSKPWTRADLDALNRQPQQ
jgi:phage terminase large subunit